MIIDRPPSATGKAAVAEIQEFVGGRRLEIISPFCFFDEIPKAKALTKAPNLGELLERAQQGDAEALAKYGYYLSLHCYELELLAREKPDFVKSVACCFSEWPMLVSTSRVRTPCELRTFLQDLDVGGSHAELPAKQTKRHDPQNLWTKYAFSIVRYLRWVRLEVAAKLEEIKGEQAVKPCRQFIMRTSHWASLYQFKDKVILLPEWQIKCPELPTRIARDHVKAIMEVFDLALREFWCAYPEHFEQVKEKISGPKGKRKISGEKTVGQYVASALDSITQALEGIAHEK